MKKVTLFFIASVYSFCYGQVDLTLGLRAYYPFTGNANDGSGNNNNPNFNNATLTADRSGNPNSAYLFNGTSNYIRIPNASAINLNSSMSICAWVKPMGFYQGNCHGNSIAMKGDGDFLPGNYALRFDDNAYTNGTNCSSPVVDITHQNFYASGVFAPSPGYTPYIQANQWYSVVYTYDGTTAKLFINCVLKASVVVSGLNFTNSYDLYLGKLNSAAFPYWFNGVMDEVRIYNRAINQAEINVYGDCSFTTGIGNIINDYTPVLAFNPCENKITVESGIKYNTGDTVLLIQMKGAVVDITNTANFGTITDYKNTGNYEINYVKGKLGNIIELKNKITRQYDVPDGKVQLVRVPYYNSVNIDATLTCLPWDGSKGGILVLNARDTITMQANIDVTGKGFKGGLGYNGNTNALGCFNNGFTYPISFQLSGNKGESITTITNNNIRGKGKLAAAGGAGLGHNSGGGGGANGGTGGFGGYQLDNCGSAPFDNRGIGGVALQNTTAANRIFLGSGGGGGQADNTGYTPSNGGNGGGIVIVIADYLKSNSQKVLANGADGSPCVQPDCHDAMGGGGSGGTVLMSVNNYIDNADVIKNGGKGGSVLGNIAAGGRIGPGGGGGGGTLFINKPSLPPTVASTSLGGANGVLVNSANEPWGATPGAVGLNIFNITVPVDNVLFKPNIDSVRIKDSSTACLAFDFNGFGFTNTNPIATWNWFFGDGGTANTQNPSHLYPSAGTFTVKLVVTDINGCKDSILRNVVSNVLTVSAGTDSILCGNTVSVQLHGTGTGGYTWTPAANLDNSTIADPTATISITTTFYVTVTGPSGCFGKDSVTITVNPPPAIQTLPDTAICRGANLLLTSNGVFDTYNWTPVSAVSDPSIANPVFTGTSTTTLIITGSIAGGCSASDTTIVTLKPLPLVNAGNDITVCGPQVITLSATGAFTYTWSPPIFLSDPNSASPVFSGNTSTTYFITGTAANGCQAKDTVSVNISSLAALVQPPNKNVCSKEAVELDGGNGNSFQYLWSPSTNLNNTAIINPVANPPASTSFSVTITDPVCNFDSVFTVLVTVRPLPVIDATRSNDIDCAIRTSRLTATGGSQYTWTPSGSLTNSTISNPVASPVASTLYIVTGTDNAGCKNKDSVMVLLKGGMNGYDIPNSFTPNGDGKNDCFSIKHWGDAQNVYFIIYNRWGEKVFETTNVNTCWDGTYKGVPADHGNYVYYAKALTACGDMVKKGNVLLIR